jgi:hypothetical protein
MVTIRPLRIEEHAEIFTFRFDKGATPTFNAAWRPEDAEEAVMSTCSSLITIVCRDVRVVNAAAATGWQWSKCER